ncbi:reverse transcriptase family protein [Chryseobacterium arthrosphaerae]|uniref:reverse transcriptase family protein n=1 Tax=Chryseobacterium arthrosphaerae TaxID=651561 RepID=UPI00241C2043|nr:reverse transcriptase family protein [Chryseobacterium arthrosphaerae]
MPFPVKQFIINAKKRNKSQDYIKECLFYIQNLEKNNFPVIFSIVHLAVLMGVQSDYLNILTGDRKEKRLSESGLELFNFKDLLLGKEIKTYRSALNYSDLGLRPFRYKIFLMKKKRRGYREIMAPSKDLKYIQKWILVNILSKYELSNSCKGFRKGISIYDNAKPHESAKVILKIDLLKFYDTITEKRIYGVFKSLGYAKNLSYSLAKICTFPHGRIFWEKLTDQEREIFSSFIENNPSILPQGAPTSPMLANIVAKHMDIRFENLGLKLNFQYSRYADDLTFSVKEDGRLPSIRYIKKIIEEEGFFINEDKISLMKKGTKQYVTGLTTTNGINVSKKWRKELSTHILYCRKLGVENHLNFRKEKKNEFKNYSVLNYHDWLYGHICFINSINKKHSQKLLDDFNKINWFFD